MEEPIKKTLVTKDSFGFQQSYIIREKIPLGYVVWNIGANMGHDEYIPVAMPNGKFSIDETTISAVHMSRDEVQVIRRAASMGILTQRAARAKANWLARSGKHPAVRALAEKAAVILAKYSE